MKKAVVFAFMFSLISACVFAGSWTSWEDYQLYKEAKEAASAASDAGDTATAVAEYRHAAELSAKSATKEIQAWQLNNAGYALIKKFKADTNYQEKIDKLSAMDPSREKIEYQKELAGGLDAQIAVLDEAAGILEEGKALFAAENKEEKSEDGEPEEAENTAASGGPLEKIQSNLDFIQWVKDFIKDNK